VNVVIEPIPPFVGRLVVARLFDQIFVRLADKSNGAGAGRKRAEGGTCWRSLGRGGSNDACVASVLVFEAAAQPAVEAWILV
jgi:hypothetical protein